MDKYWTIESSGTATGKVRMMAIGRSSLQEIENHLIRMGRGNHSDNMERLRRFECHCSVRLVEREFFELVFLQTPEVRNIAPPGADRTLRAAAKRAINLGQPRLSGNWDLAENLRRTREKLGQGNIFQEALVVCESRNGEERWGPWYLQDGSHRALACATLILLNEAQYVYQIAYCSMSEPTYQNLLNRTP
jgi:hypothetical protein